MRLNYKKAVAFPLLVLLGLLTPLYSAHAIADAIGRLVATYTMAGIIGVFLGLSLEFLILCSRVLQWVLSENFINFTYTNPAGNPIIQAGWTLTRDLTNMALVIALAFMGLATAIRWKEYEIQKTLVPFVIVALLINFTPLLTGIVVDAANIIMSFFLTNLSGVDLVTNQSAVQTAQIRQTLGAWFNPVNQLEMVAQAFLVMVFNIFAGIMILAFAALFAVRYLAIWILVILSPVAFFGYIFKLGFWKTWRQQFLQWCFVGATAAFFLYLGNHILVVAPRIIRAEPPATVPNVWVGLLNTVLPFGMSLAFLGIGFFMSLASGAIGASMIISKAQGWTKRGGGWLQTKARTEVGKRARGVARERMPHFVQRGLQALATKQPLQPTPEELSREARLSWTKRGVKRAGRTILGIPGISTATRRLGSLALAEGELAEISKAREEIEKLADAEKALTQYRASANRAERIGRLQGLIKKDWAGKITEEEIIRGGREALQTSPEAFSPIQEKYPHLIEQMTRGREVEGVRVRGVALPHFQAAGLILKDEDREKYGTYLGKVIGTASAKTIENWDKKMKDELVKDENMEVIQKFWGGSQIRAAADKFGTEFVDRLMEKVSQKPVDWYLNNNPQQLIYLTGNAAQDLGFTPPEGIERTEVKTRIKEIRLLQGLGNDALQQEIERLDQEIANLRQAATPIPGGMPVFDRAQQNQMEKFETRLNQLTQEKQRREARPAAAPAPAPAPAPRPPRGGQPIVGAEKEEETGGTPIH